MPEVILPGASGRIEGRYSPGKRPDAPIALILHPHPKAGGHMNNPVALTMHQLFVQRGFATLRYNSRGVGKSQGEFDSGIGELADAATALDWLQANNPAATQTWVAGYQFGAYIGMQLLMRRPETDGFISVSPPSNIYDFSFLAPCPASGLFLHGTADTVVPRPRSSAWSISCAPRRASSSTMSWKKARPTSGRTTSALSSAASAPIWTNA
ncbi:alpha/beta hydrolase [Brevundimonas vancanneytii]|uniref:Hydrolase CocE/NonD family protein n=1 Tax=Brevundimonas vancanneytii TaxID=1325724 RepID=A0A4P1K714_9CAUL|nr:hydrolase CocE/NonD family protein [Brevundimonas vancanneytii]